MSWFSFTGTNPTNPSHYTFSPTPPTCAIPTQQLCSLQAMNDGSNNPVITESLKDEMILALNSQANGTNVKLKSR